MNDDFNRLRNHCVILCLLFAFCFPLAAGADAASDRELTAKAKQVWGPLPQTMPSSQNPITPAKVKLGKMLFYESRISVDGTVSCAKCHPLSLYAADGLKKAIGNSYRVLPRNSPTVFNAAGQISGHWTGNRKNVEDQAKQSLVGPPAFGMPSYGAVEKILRGSREYVKLFSQAFPGGKEPVTADNFARAVGAFERTLVTPAPVDDFMKGNTGALAERQKRGLTAMLGAGCSGCHMNPYFGGQMYQKFGLFAPYWTYTKSSPVDEGRFEDTKDEADKYFFKVPVLRNVAMTRPYFHDGSVAELGQAVWIMGKVQLGKELTREQVDDIVAFLGSLTGRIPPEALVVPVLPLLE